MTKWRSVTGVVGWIATLSVGLWLAGVVRVSRSYAWQAEHVPEPDPPVQLILSPVLGYVLDNNNDEATRVDGPTYAQEVALKSGETIADIGCGTGVHSMYFSRVVGPKGKVYAVDIDANAVRYVEGRARVLNLTNLEAMQSKPDDVRLPAGSLDCAIFVNVLHCIIGPSSQHDEGVFHSVLEPLFKSIHRALKPGGRLLLYDSIPSPQIMNGTTGIDQQVVEHDLERCGFRIQSSKLNGASYTYIFVPR